MGAGRSAARVSERVRSLVTADDLVPAVPQLAFSGLLALDAMLRFLGGTPVPMRSWPALSLVLAGVLTVAAAALPWHRFPQVVLGVVPLLDMGVVGLARLDSQVGGAGLLVVIPALWLGQIFGRRGALVTLGAVALLVVLPGLLYFDLTASVVSRALLIPAVAVAASLAIAAALSRSRGSLADAERRQGLLEEALEEIERHRRFSQAILDTVDVGLVLLDGDGTYRAINRRHQAFMDLAYPEGHAGRAGQLGLVYDANGTTPLECEQMPTYRASQGEEFDDCLIWIGHDPRTNRAVSVSARSVRDEAGRFAGAALAYNDVTDFMRALRVKDEFVASVSHELRTPLTSIVGYVDILRDHPDLPREVLGHLGVVARNTDRLQRLVADLLHTAQVDEGPMQVMRTSTDLSRIVRNAVEAASPAAQAGGIELEVEIPESLVVSADEQRMAQVVDNLISNAIKYSPGGGCVRVRLVEADGFVDLSVSDTGIGINTADLERLFTRFFRGQHAAEQSIQGVGLGLSIVMSIVESHGGRIDVESEPGKGSTFRVLIPVD